MLEPGPIGSVWRPIAGTVPCPGSRQTSGVGAAANTGTKSACGRAALPGQSDRERDRATPACTPCPAPAPPRLGSCARSRGGDLWAAGEPPPRTGCSLDVLIDGSEARPRLARELAGARSRVHLAGRYVSPEFAVTRDEERITLRALLARLAERIPVRVLLWAGSPLPLFHPDRGDVDGVRHALT